MQNASYKTAIARRALSAPTAYLLEQGLLRGNVLDYGCGRGGDVERLTNMPEFGGTITGWDPYWNDNPDAWGKYYDTIICNYVLNVIPEPADRARVIHSIRNTLVPGGKAYVAVRRDVQNEGYGRNGAWQGNVELDETTLMVRKGAFVIYVITRPAE